MISESYSEHMQELKDEIISSLRHEPGMLACLLRRHEPLGPKLAAWFAGEKPVLLIGGEPGMGKSLLMGDLAMQYELLAQVHQTLCRPLALISYDRVHFLFLKCLAERTVPGQRSFLPEGETHLEARQLISLILQELLLFAACRLAPGTRIILEAPLIGQRGENLLAMLPDMAGQIQVLILHSPAMWEEILRQQPARETSAHALAMRQIHEVLLYQRAILPGEQEIDLALQQSWQAWLKVYDGCLLTWNPHEDRGSYLHTQAALQAHEITPDPLSPELLQEHTLVLIGQIFELLPDLKSFARTIQRDHLPPSGVTEGFYPRIMQHSCHIPPEL